VHNIIERSAESEYIVSSRHRMNYINLYYLVDYTLYLFLAFSQCSTSTPNAFDGHTEFLWVFNFTILSYS